ncbi:TetR/AcrR family transcriptional regulator [Conyzicola nivalis]|uniref:TetR/AcrR family transcriptional regulator n=1 Tax=Conyzicola nivalis TaxID=1477021 RepID=UPI00166C92F6|nr:TetR/AcrR family transcriptional regulator [Conyzicola nivalis]
MRERVLEVADYLFYTDGINQTSVDAIAFQADVSTRAFARAFASKEDLIVAYVNQRHESDVDLFSTIAATELSHQLVLNMVLSEVIIDVTSPGFHGCAFINAAIECREYLAVQAAVKNHREWYTGAATEVLRQAGHHYPADAADDVLLARDGAMNSGYGGDPTAATAALRRAIDRVLAEIPDTSSSFSI